ncbi:MAG: acyltransferase family protein, partial [Mucilaginibacter sp.]
KKFDALTGLRCIAACMIFVYHNRKYWRSFLPSFMIQIFNEFYLGVSIFFVLSGFLIAYNYSKVNISSPSEYLSYLFKRIGRIFPVYWLVLTAYYVDNKFGNFHFSMLTYSLFHGFSERHNLDAIAQAWSLTVEMTFYFFAPFMLFLIAKKLSFVFYFLVALFFISWGIGFALHHSQLASYSFLYPFDFLLTDTFAGQSALFLFGILLAKYFENNDLRFVSILNDFKYKTPVGLISLLVIIIYLATIQNNLYDQSNNHWLGNIIQLTILPATIIFFIWGLIDERTGISWFLSSKLLMLLGNASFAFYLIHISYVNLKIKQYVLLPDRNFILLWAMSIAIYFIYEKPIYSFIKQVVSKRVYPKKVKDALIFYFTGDVKNDGH